MWSDTLELAQLEIVVNENGVEEKKLNTREVYCNKKSVGINEFYQSGKDGREIKIIFEVKQFDYEEEVYIVFGKETYEVVRSYEANSEDIELHCRAIKGLI